MKKLVLITLITILSACVTINIYFPAAAAEKAADKIIDDVWQLKDDAKSTNDKPSGTDIPKSEQVPVN